MALPSTIHRVTIQLNDIDRGVYETLQATVARHPSETEERLVARLLAYALFFEPELTFTKGICATDEPDLWIKGPDDRVQLWLEVGIPEPDRIIKACRHSKHVALVVCGKTFANWEQNHLPKLADIPNLSIISLEQALIERLKNTLERSINWEVTITDGNLYINTGGETFEAVFQAYAADR